MIYIKSSLYTIGKSKFLTLLVLSSVLAFSALGQKANILYSSADLNSFKRSNQINKIIYGPLYSTIKVKFTDGSVKKIDKSDIWGYIDTNGDIYRQYNRDFFKIIDQSSLIKYTKTNLHSQGARYPRPLEESFFSRTLDSKIYDDSLKVLSEN